MVAVSPFITLKNTFFYYFKSLLNKNITSLDLSHDKWFRDLTQQSITVKSQIYRLMITENKIKWFSY